MRRYRCRYCDWRAPSERELELHEENCPERRICVYDRVWCPFCRSEWVIDAGRAHVSHTGEELHRVECKRCLGVFFILCEDDDCGWILSRVQASNRRTEFSTTGEHEY